MKHHIVKHFFGCRKTDFMINHYSGSSIEQSVWNVFLCLSTTTFKLSGLWPRCSAFWFKCEGHTRKFNCSRSQEISRAQQVLRWPL